MRSSSGGQNGIVHHLVGGRPLRNLRTGRPLTEFDETRCCIIQFLSPDDEHIVFETCTGI